jgi:hypothetical protein
VPVSPRPSNLWTDERVAKLRELHPQGLPYSNLASALNLLPGPTLTRNSISGKCDRLGLSVTAEQRSINQRASGVRYSQARRAERQERPKAKPKPPKPRTARMNIHPSNIVRSRNSRIHDPGLREKPPVIDYTHARPWIERKPGQCAFPIGTGGDLLSCCAPTERTYCRACETVMYQPEQPTRKSTMRMARLAA